MASAIMAILMIGVLQMFSLALVTNFGSAARTELTYRAQQVVENLRMLQFFARAGNTAPAAAAGVTTGPAASGNSTILAVAAKAISNDPVATDYAYWHAAGVVGDKDDAFRISYTVQNIATLTPPSGQAVPPWAASYFLVTVTATPVDAPGHSASGMSAASTTSRLYLGLASQAKRVDYVAQIPR